MSEWVAALLVAVGLGFFAAGSVGLLRLPDLHSRLHALTKADNLGLGLLATGLAVLEGDLLTTLKLFLVWLLVLAASAASTHLIAQRALRRGMAPGAPTSASESSRRTRAPFRATSARRAMSRCPVRRQA